MNSKFNNNFKLQEADRAEITTIIDNYTDALLRSTEVAKRPRIISQAPLAEHGLIYAHKSI